jgi:hypothetical protein
MSFRKRSGREFGESKDEPINWRRGLFRMWVLLSTAWIMGWTIQLIMSVLQNGVQTTGDVLVMPVLLLGPPLALLLFGIGAGWTLRGFKVDDNQSAPNERSTAPPEPPVAPEESTKVARLEPRGPRTE